MQRAFLLVAMTIFAASSLDASEQSGNLLSQAVSASVRTSTDPAAAVSSGPKLIGKTAWDRLVGNSIAGTEDGKALVEFYAADGTAKSMMDNQISTGNWTLEGEAICFKYSGVPKECYRIEVFGDAATFYNEKGDGGRYAILKGNPHGL